MNYLHFLEKEIRSVVMATLDDRGLPVTCAIGIMDSDEDGLYFLTAKGKGFYARLKKDGFAALTGTRCPGWQFPCGARCRNSDAGRYRSYSKRIRI